MAPRASPNQNLGATILDRTRISIKDNTTTRISNLSSGKQIHGKSRNKRNIGNKKGRSGKGVATSDRKGSAVSSKNRKRKLKRAKERITQKSQNSYEKKL
jgi:hypothetical protein